MEISHALDPLRTAVGEQWDRLSPAERTVCRHLLDTPPQQLLFASAQELGSGSGTSNATVVRTVQRLGYSGLSALKQEIAASFSTEVAPEVRLAARLERAGQDLAGAWDRIVDEARERLEHCRLENDVATLEEAVKLLAGAREVVAYGTAASEHGARHLARKLTRLGVRARAVDSTGFAFADELVRLRDGDVVIIFQPGRMLREIVLLIERARTVGARCVLITDELAKRLPEPPDVVLSAPHTPTGMTAEALTGLIVADLLIHALASLDEPRAVQNRHELTELRRSLLHGELDPGMPPGSARRPSPPSRDEHSG